MICQSVHGEPMKLSRVVFAVFSFICFSVYFSRLEIRLLRHHIHVEIRLLMNKKLAARDRATLSPKCKMMMEHSYLYMCNLLKSSSITKRAYFTLWFSLSK